MDITTLAAAKAYTDKKTSESGGSSLVAGDLLEIKDGVVRCTLGDLKSGEIKEEIDEIFGVNIIEEMDSYGDPVVYEYYTESINKFPKLNETLTIEFTKPDGTKKTMYVDIDGEEWDSDAEYYGYYNCEKIEIGKELVLTKIDESLDAVYIFFYRGTEDGEEYGEMMLQTFEDFTDTSLFVGYKTITEKKEYVLLPDTALGLGREIEVEVDEEILNVEVPEMENMETAYLGMVENAHAELFVGDTINANITLPNESSSTTLISEVTEFTVEEEISIPIASFNCTLSMSEETGAPVVTKLDNTLPAFIVWFVFNDGDPIAQIISADDYTGASIVVSKKAVVKTNVKLPNEALSFDFEPTEGSTNLVNSGDLFNILGDIKTVIADINNLVGGAS